MNLPTPVALPLPAANGVRLPHWGLMRARGADAASFLQSQLSNDILGMTQSQARLAGFCSAKGRLQASFIVWKLAQDDLLLACAADLLPATLKRLSMFVLRAKCKLSDAGDEWSLLGFEGAGEPDAIDLPVWGLRTAIDSDDASRPPTFAIRLPDAQGRHRVMMAVPATATLRISDAQTLRVWREDEVRSGVPLIEAATVDQFVPQMVNLELLGGVDFRKGCYPGQEVVARSQYRGTLKRRTYLFEVAAAAQVAQEVFHSDDPDQPSGMVVNAARLINGGSVVLVALKIAALNGGGLHLGRIDGPLLRPEALPYAIPGDADAPTASA
jgi:folate-binding protein YgfZ